MFAPAVREKLKARIAVDGPSGSGKTYTALRLAFEFIRQMEAAGQPMRSGHKIAVIDTEKKSATKYVNDVVDGEPWKFDAEYPTRYAPKWLSDAIHHCAREGYGVIVIDSLTHFWEGPGGVLDLVGGNFNNWKKVRPIEAVMWDAITGADIHVICTMRTKTEYVMEEDHRGKKSPVRVGTATKQRDGAEYEFDIALRLDHMNVASIDKTRVPGTKGRTYPEPGPDLARTIWEWLERGDEPAEAPPAPAWHDGLVAKFAALGVDVAAMEDYVGDSLADWTIEKHRPRIVDYAKSIKGVLGEPPAEGIADLKPGESITTEFGVVTRGSKGGLHFTAATGQWCTCKGFRLHGGVECKHTKAILAAADEAPAADKAVA